MAVIHGPNSTHNKAPTRKTTIFCDNNHKNEVIIYGALVGALFPRNANKNNNKQHVNRGYDSESGHHFSFFMLSCESLCCCDSRGWRKKSFRYVLIYPLVSGKNGVRLRVVQYDKLERPLHVN